MALKIEKWAKKKIETCKRCRKLFPVDLCFSVGQKKWREIDENGEKLKKIAKSKGYLIRESEEYSHFPFEIKLNTFLHLCRKSYKKNIWLLPFLSITTGNGAKSPFSERRWAVFDTFLHIFGSSSAWSGPISKWPTPKNRKFCVDSDRPLSF